MKRKDVGGQAVIEGVMMRGSTRNGNSSKKRRWRD